MSSEAQISANRANGKLSTGPATPEGKAKSSLNAVKTGLTGRTVLLPSDDAVAYQKHVERFFNQYKPVGDEEASLAQSLADTEWRLLRIPSLELGIYALGCLEFASKFEHEDPAIQSALLDAYVFQTHQKQLNNLSVQEARLRKHRGRHVCRRRGEDRTCRIEDRTVDVDADQREKLCPIVGIDLDTSAMRRDC